MIIIIGLLLFFIIFIIFSFKIYNKNEKIFEIICSVILFMIIIIGTYPLFGFDTPQLQKDVEIVSFNEEFDKKDGTEYYLICVSNSYIYKYKEENNCCETYEIPANIAQINENSKCKKPHIRIYKKSAIENMLTFTANQGIYSYYIEIPKNSIKNIDV